MRKPMQSATQQLHMFLAACRGNWRNTVSIAGRDGHSHYLLAADRDGRPIIVDAARFTALTGEQVDPAECQGHLEEMAFRDIFAQYLLWQLPSAGGNVLQALSQMEFQHEKERR